MMHAQRKRGFSLVEVLVGAAIILLVISGIGASFSMILKAGRMSVRNVQAAYILAEGGEALLQISREGWSSFATLSLGTSYHLAFSGSLWTATSAPQLIDSTFTRTFLLERVYRDGSNDIAASGTEDANARKVTIAVSFARDGATTTKSLVMYLFREE